MLTPSAAAIAAVLFSVLILSALPLLIHMVGPGLNYSGERLRSDAWKVALAHNLIPCAGVAFLWFIHGLRHML
ncbi:hypothetical protein ACMDCR_31805 [Labrys okinawensis]|uniref:hypothetical protein n=1 Tax=Labrys okinawensis TaxID=346911 RepID=UPI0039BC26FD